MTSNKARKASIRERMKKTGERYTAARLVLVGPRHETEDLAQEPVRLPTLALVVPSGPDQELPAGASPHGVMPDMSSATIHKETGRHWSEWLAVLDTWGAADRTHKEIAAHVHAAHGVDGWWAQSVTVGYERLRGRRVVGQVGDGVFAGSASKTLPANAHDVFAHLTEEPLRDRWLDAGTLQMRTSVADKSARFDLVEPAGIVGFFLTARGPAKCAISVQHDRLPSKAAAEAFRAAWKEHFGRLAEVLAEALADARRD